MSSHLLRKVCYSICTLYVAFVSRLVPNVRRPCWTAEWNAELWQLLQTRYANSNGKRITLIPFLFGALKHALWERRCFR